MEKIRKGIAMVYILIALLYVSVILIMTAVSSQHIGYDVPRKMPGMLNHEKCIDLVKMKKTRSMWDE